MTDAVNPSFSILLITQLEAGKGKTLKRLKEKHGWDCPVIAAGDGSNDICLLAEADIGIAMENGSELLKKNADIIAKPSREKGIIDALGEAIKKI